MQPPGAFEARLQRQRCAPAICMLGTHQAGPGAGCGWQNGRTVEWGLGCGVRYAYGCLQIQFSGYLGRPTYDQQGFSCVHCARGIVKLNLTTVCPFFPGQMRLIIVAEVQSLLLPAATGSI